MPILRIDNRPLVEGKESTYLTATANAASGTITVQNIEGYAVGQYLLLGEFGSEDAEIVRIHASTAPSGTTITLNANTVRSHTVGTRVTQIDYNQLEFSRATTATGTKSVLSTEDIEADDTHTLYNDTTNSTGFGFGRFKNSASTTYSSYSGAIPYTGLARNSVRKMKDNALGLTGETTGNLITEDFLLTELNNWQQDVMRQRNWNFLATSTTSTVVSGQKTYSVPTNLKHPHEASGIIQIRIRDQEALDVLDKRQYDVEMMDTVSTTLAADIALVDTTITLTDSSDFADSGTILIGDGSDDTITYTSKNDTTNVLSGVTGISTTHTSGATVWQTSSLDEPVNFMVYEDLIYLEPVPSTNEHGYTIYIDYYKNLAELDDDTDTTEIPFYEIAQYYLAWKAEAKKKNREQADYWRQLYENRLAAEIRKDQPAVEGRFYPIGLVR